MGKSKRNDKKATGKSKQLIKDFEKKKRKKLGKKKLKPANATEISFRSHRIHVTKQSLKDQNRELRKSVALISFDIKESLIHLSHHKAKVRRDVLIELKCILSRIENDDKTFRNVLHENLVEIVSIFELVYDTECIVRNGLRTFMNWFMPRCKHHIVLFGPFWSSILAHLSAALSHINTSIRYNALKILRSFFSVSCAATYFNNKWCLSLLSHLQLLFYDIIRRGHFILNDDDVKMITSLSNTNTNSNTQKVKKTPTNRQETIVIVHILCECSTHIIKVIQKQMHNNHDSMENNLHDLLLPNDDKRYESNKLDDDNDWNMINSDNMDLLKSLLCIFTSCSLIFEQFAKKKKYCAMNIVLTLCCIIADCLCDRSLKQLMNDDWKYQQKQLQKYKKLKSKFKVNDLRLFITKSLMSLFNVFPIEFVDKKMDNNEDKQMDRAYVMRMNIKTIKMCCLFIEYWNLNVLQPKDDHKNNKRKRQNYLGVCYQWLNNCFKNMASNTKDTNAKILSDVLQILKTLIGYYDENKQLQLLLSLDKLMKNSTCVKDLKTIFTQIVN